MLPALASLRGGGEGGAFKVLKAQTAQAIKEENRANGLGIRDF